MKEGETVICGDIIRGLANIVAYTGYSKKIIKELHLSRGFPMGLMGGVWESSKTLIDEWRRTQIQMATEAGPIFKSLLCLHILPVKIFILRSRDRP